jgi:hypothetical protein
MKGPAEERRPSRRAPPRMDRLDRQIKDPLRERFPYDLKFSRQTTSAEQTVSEVILAEDPKQVRPAVDRVDAITVSQVIERADPNSEQPETDNIDEPKIAPAVLKTPKTSALPEVTRFEPIKAESPTDSCLSTKHRGVSNPVAPLICKSPWTPTESENSESPSISRSPELFILDPTVRSLFITVEPKTSTSAPKLVFDAIDVFEPSMNESEIEIPEGATILESVESVPLISAPFAIEIAEQTIVSPEAENDPIIEEVQTDKFPKDPESFDDTIPYTAK